MWKSQLTHNKFGFTIKYNCVAKKTFFRGNIWHHIKIPMPVDFFILFINFFIRLNETSNFLPHMRENWEYLLIELRCNTENCYRRYRTARTATWNSQHVKKRRVTIILTNILHICNKRRGSRRNNFFWEAVPLMRGPWERKAYLNMLPLEMCSRSFVQWLGDT